MKNSISSWAIGTSLCLAVVAQCAVVTVMAQTSRPIEEMRGNCDDYALDVRSELAAMKGTPRKLSALTSRVTAPPISPMGQSLLVTLHHAEQVTHAVTPRRSGSYAGLLAFSVPADGDYRVSAGSALWIEVVEGHSRLEPIQFEMQMGCDKLFKTVQYRLTKDVGYWLELSGNTATASIVLSPETR